jgi:hypothetical protein
LWEGHGQVVCSIATSPHHDSYFATASHYDCSVCIWELPPSRGSLYWIMLVFIVISLHLISHSYLLCFDIK